jgi:hypothetical protein
LIGILLNLPCRAGPEPAFRFQGTSFFGGAMSLR